MSLEIKINTLIDAVMTELSLNQRDFIYYKNKISQICRLEPTENSAKITFNTIPELLEDITSLLVKEQKIENSFDVKEIVSAQIMDTFIPLPSEIEEQFYQHYERSPVEATNYFYHLSTVSNYIRVERIKKNIHYKSTTTYGELDITINLSKPEKNPQEIKELKKLEEKQPASNYPKCMLCVENEGYAGRINYPARSNHRIVSLKLNQEQWYFQYSPYSYYNEHAIILNENHVPMIINKATFKRLIEFVTHFPHYFIGSNADLPIVGGSMLTHDHYQAGCYKFAMDITPSIYHFSLPQFTEVSFDILKWPLSVIRLKSKNPDEIIEAATYISSRWKNYSDESIELIAETDEIHNTITPIARFSEGNFELDLVLRNNRTSEQHPMGIFHPHERHHHIKKENIGLIEVLGLAVLPARLKQDIQDIKAYLKDNNLTYNPIHKDWVASFDIQNQDIDQYVDNALANKFAEILEDAGIFKNINDFKRFITQL